MPDGTYMLGDLPVEVRDGVCRYGQTLAGSVLTMDKAVENLQDFTGSSLQTAVRLCSHNPATMLAMTSVGKIAVGQRGDFNVFNEQSRFAGSILRGRRMTL